MSSKSMDFIFSDCRQWRRGFVPPGRATHILMKIERLSTDSDGVGDHDLCPSNPLRRCSLYRCKASSMMG
jgi:hypothetical protein